jgi:hypothetical protein
MPDHTQDFSYLLGDFRNPEPATMTSMNPAHVYEIRPRKDDCGVNLISDVLPLRCAVLSGGPDAIDNAIDYAKLYSRSHVAVIRVYDEEGNVTETHEHSGDFKKP